MTQSAQDFKAVVWPRLAPGLGGGELIPVETVTDSPFARLLDMEAGIDAWQLLQTGGMRAIASRVQWGLTCWETWTIRRRRINGSQTEYDKLINADLTLARPGLHIQAYLARRGGPLLGAACIRTADLIRLLLAGKHGEERVNGQDGVPFIPVHWDMAMDQGYTVWKAVP